MDARGRKSRSGVVKDAPTMPDAGEPTTLPFTALADEDFLNELLSVPHDDDVKSLDPMPTESVDAGDRQRNSHSRHSNRASPLPNKRRSQSPVTKSNPPNVVSKKRPLYRSDFNDPSDLFSEDANDSNNTAVLNEDKPKRKKPVGMMAKCFNCNETGHAVSDCKYARNYQNIKRNREMHSMLKRSGGGSSNNQRVLTLNQSAMQADVSYADVVVNGGNEHDQDANTVAISDELAGALSYSDIRYRVPPFLYNMRRLGYPPAYVEAAVEKQLVFVDFEDDAKKSAGNAGQINVKKLVNIQGLTTPMSLHEKLTREDDKKRNPRLYAESSKRFPEIDSRYHVPPPPRHGSSAPNAFASGPVLWAAEYRNANLEKQQQAAAEQHAVETKKPNGLLPPPNDDSDVNNSAERKKQKKQLKLKQVIAKLHASTADSLSGVDTEGNKSDVSEIAEASEPNGVTTPKRKKRRRKNKKPAEAENEPRKKKSTAELEEGEISNVSNSSSSCATSATSPSRPSSSGSLPVTPPQRTKTISPAFVLTVNGSKSDTKDTVLPIDADMPADTPPKAVPTPQHSNEDIISIKSYDSMKLGTYSSVNILPGFDAFAKGVTSHINYENLPNSAGRFKRIMELFTLKKNKTAVVVESSSTTTTTVKSKADSQQRSSSRRSKREESVEFISSHKTIVKQRAVTPNKHGKSTADWRYRK